jgi:signal transduction histidine kinase
MDPAQLDQVLANLCIRGRDAISAISKITLKTDKRTFDRAFCAHHTDYLPGNFVLLEVSDNGCGMDRETLANIFEPFYTTKQVGQGTGLGRATVYGIVQQNKGFIMLSSDSGLGTTFKIYSRSTRWSRTGCQRQLPGTCHRARVR